MQHFSFKIIVLYMFLPSVFYLFSIQMAEKYFQDQSTKKNEMIYTGDTRLLFKGDISLKDAVNKNIDIYLQQSRLLSWGIKIKVNVITKNGNLLYPAIFEEKERFIEHDSIQIAADNYKLMNDGLIVSVDLKIPRNSKISLGLIFFYLLLFIISLYLYYKTGTRKNRVEETERLFDLKDDFENTLHTLDEDRQEIYDELQQYKENFESEKKRADTNEIKLIEEIILLEEKLTVNLSYQENQIEEINILKEAITKLEKGKNKQQETKAEIAVQKRFDILYKKIQVNKRAVSGFINLSEDMKNKSEEIIHQLNDNSQLVPVKRKVFSGKGAKKKVFEIIFSYTGRLYYTTAQNNKIEILSIGTKKTQAKDLVFLKRM